MQDLNLNPPSFYDSEIEEIEETIENSVENISNYFAIVTNRHDKKEVSKGLKMMLDMAKEPGMNTQDIIAMLHEIYENF